MSICHMESSSKAEQGAGAPESSSQRKAAWGWLGTVLGAGSLYCLAIIFPRTYLSIVTVYVTLGRNIPRSIVGTFPDSLWKNVLTVI